MDWRSAALAVLLASMLLLGCQQLDDFGCPEGSRWPGRPDCRPVGTTVTSVVDCDPDGDACLETRRYDEVGESGQREVAWRN
ncbi:MAG: hypothetical protein ACRDX9_01140 [Acidimicrobiia bacterium]